MVGRDQAYTGARLQTRLCRHPETPPVLSPHNTAPSQHDTMPQARLQQQKEPEAERGQVLMPAGMCVWQQ